MSPSDDEMDGIRRAFIESTTSRSGPNNALANTVLTDDEPPSSSSAQDAEPIGPPAKPPPEQRIQLLQALLSLGDVAAAQYFLSRYPWTAQSHPAIADLIIRLIADALEDIFRNQVPGLEAVDQDLEPTDIPPAAKEIVPTLYAPSPPETPTRLFKFFYPDWRLNSEKWTSLADVHDKGLRWFSLIRGMGGRAGAVMAKICRVGAKYFESLKEAKELELGIASGTTKRDEMRQVEVSLANWCATQTITHVAFSPPLLKWNHGSTSHVSFYYPLFPIHRLRLHSTLTCGPSSSTFPTLSGISCMGNGATSLAMPRRQISTARSPSRRLQNVPETSRKRSRE